MNLKFSLPPLCHQTALLGCPAHQAGGAAALGRAGQLLAGLCQSPALLLTGQTRPSTAPRGLQHLPKPAPSCTGQQHTPRRSMSAPKATFTPAQQEGSVPALPHQRCHNNFDYKHFSSPCNFRQILEFQSPTFFFVRMTMTSLYLIKFSHLISSQENTNK